jgi:hypothetical protein
VAKLTDLKIESVVESADTNPVAFGLLSPACAIRVLPGRPDSSTNAAARPAPEGVAAAPPGRERSACLLVGAGSGSTNAVFVKFEDSATVLTVAAESVRALGANLTDPLVFRDRTMLAVSADSVRKLALRKGDTEQMALRAEGGEWTVAAPASNALDRAAIDDTIALLANLRAIRIESHNPKSLAVYGLDRSAVTLTLGLSGNEGIQKTILMGFRARTDGVFALVQGQDVVFVLANAVAERLARDLLKPAESTGAGSGAQTK